MARRSFEVLYILDGPGIYAGKYLVWQHGRPEIAEIETVVSEEARILGRLYNELVARWSRLKERRQKLEQELPSLLVELRRTAGRVGGLASAIARLSNLLRLLQEIRHVDRRTARLVARALSILWRRYVPVREVLELGDEAIILAVEGLRARIEEYEKRLEEGRRLLAVLRERYRRLRREYQEVVRELEEVGARLREVEDKYEEALRRAERRKRVLVEDVDDNIVVMVTISVETTGHESLKGEIHAFTRIPRDLLKRIDEVIEMFSECARYTVFCHLGQNVKLSSIIKEGVSVYYDSTRGLQVAGMEVPLFPETVLDIEYTNGTDRTYTEYAECYEDYPYSSYCTFEVQYMIRQRWRQKW